MESTNPEKKYNNIELRLPVKIGYQVLQAYLQKKLLGKILSKGKANGETSDHARIEAISLSRSSLEDFDLAVHVQLKLLTTLFRGKNIFAVAHLSIDFLEEDQEVLVRRYKLDSDNNGWFIDRIVETLINNFLYSKLKDRMKFDIRPVIAARLEKLNQRLSGGLEVADGVNITGKIQEFRVQEVIPGQRTLLVSVSILGNNVLNIRSIDIP